MRTSSYIEWCNENAGRSYPIASEATQLDRHGRALPNDIIVDLGLMVPYEYRDVYCTSVRVTPNLIGVSFACSDAPLLVGLVNKSIYTPYTAVSLTPLTEDVSGWIVYGSANSTRSDLFAFSSAEQSGIEDRAIRVVDRPPVWRILRYGGGNDIYVDGLVRLSGGDGISVYKDLDNPTNIIVELDPERAPRFMGPCNQYGDATNCQYAPIVSINGVTPDEDGFITIRFEP